MRHRSCPVCGYHVPSTGLRIALSPPNRLGASWPRAYCPRCNAELRSNNRSLAPSFALFIVAMAALVASTLVAAPLTEVLHWIAIGAGAIACLLAYWFHRWEAVR